MEHIRKPGGDVGRDVAATKGPRRAVSKSLKTNNSLYVPEEEECSGQAPSA